MMTFVHRRIGLLILVIVTIAVMAALPAVDQQWTVALHEHKDRALIEVMGRSLFEGDAPGANDLVIFYLLGTLIAYYLGWRRPKIQGTLAWRPHTGFMICSAFMGGIYLVHGLKWMVGRARPGLVLDGWPFTQWYEFGPHFITEGIYRGSFPSGHTAQAFFLMALAYALAGDPTRRRMVRAAGGLIGIAVVTYTLAMGAARCMSFSHWLSDVVGSLLFGWIIMHCLYFYILQVPAQRRYFASTGKLPDMPRVWEILLVAYGFVMTIGIMMIVIGGRSIFILHLSWLLLLIPLGLLGCWIALERIFKLLNLLNARLNASVH